MEIGIVTDSLGNLKFDEMLSVLKKLGGVAGLEICCGNWSGAPHIDIDAMLAKEEIRKTYMKKIEDNGFYITALNCSGNQLHPGEKGKSHDEVVRKTFKLAELLGVRKIVMMSGLPGGADGDKTPSWIVTSWPPENIKILEWQFENIAVPYWNKTIKMAEDSGIKQIALENHGYQIVYSPETLFRLKSMLDDDKMIGLNFDPSHLQWMGADAYETVMALKGHIYHFHAKDSRAEKFKSGYTTMLDTKDDANFKERSWNYVTLGYGHDELWWKNLLALMSMNGYDGVLSIEHEDQSMSQIDGVEKSVDFLKRILPKS